MNYIKELMIEHDITYDEAVDRILALAERPSDDDEIKDYADRRGY